MYRIVMILVLVSILVYGVTYDRNWNGIDTATVTTDTVQADTMKYSRAFLLSRWGSLRWTMMVDDTTSAGFSSDSIKMVWGYQTGHPAWNVSGSLDTVWDEEMKIDTMNVDSFGVVGSGYVEPDGDVIRVWNNHADTSEILGYAYQSRWFVPEWDVLIRGWVKGLPGNKTGAPIRNMLINNRSQGVPTIDR